LTASASLTGDGRSIVAVQQETRSQLFRQRSNDAEGKDAQPLSSDSGLIVNVDWTPDGHLVIASDDRSIQIEDADGKNVQSLTTYKTGNPQLTVCGKQWVVYDDLNMEGTNFRGVNLWRMDLSGGNRKQLTSGTIDVQPVCSPDGSRVFFISQDKSRPGLCSVSIEGGEVKVLYPSSAVGSPSLSHDGNSIAFQYVSGTSIKDYRPMFGVLPITGGAISQSFPLDRTFGGTLKFSPDDKSLVLINVTNGIGNLTRLSLKDGKKEPITKFKDRLIFSYAYSNDGKNIAIIRGTTRNNVVMLTDTTK
jgi:Tol biopolymer transport system component